MPIGGSSGGLSSAGPGAGGGAQGPQGATGSQGAQGHQGFQGNQGTQGSGGAQGSQGNQGGAGSQGPQGVPGGTSVQFNSSWNENTGTAVDFTCDGAQHNNAVPWTPLITTPVPSWTDNAGHITAPGLYAWYVAVTLLAAPTTPGLWTTVYDGVGIASLLVPLDSFYGVVDTENQLFLQVITLEEADLPWAVNLSVVMPTDVTGQISVSAQVQQLAAT